MNRSSSRVVLAGVALAGLMSTGASAMPLDTLGAKRHIDGVQEVRRVCDANGRCWRTTSRRYVERSAPRRYVQRRYYSEPDTYAPSYSYGPAYGYGPSYGYGSYGYGGPSVGIGIGGVGIGLGGGWW